MRPPIPDSGPRDYSTGSRTGRWPFGTLEYWRHLARERKVTCYVLNRGVLNLKAQSDWFRQEANMWRRMPFWRRVLWALFPRRFDPNHLVLAGMSFKDVFPE